MGPESPLRVGLLGDELAGVFQRFADRRDGRPPAGRRRDHRPGSARAGAPRPPRYRAVRPLRRARRFRRRRPGRGGDTEPVARRDGPARRVGGAARRVDKPLAATSADARSVVEEAQRRGVPLTVFQNRRWDGDFLTVRRLMDEGVLGTVLRFESRFERWRPVIRQRWREDVYPTRRPEVPGTPSAPTSWTRRYSCWGRSTRYTRRSTIGERAPRSTTTIRGPDPCERSALTPVDEHPRGAVRAADAGPRRPGRLHEVRPRRAGGGAARRSAAR